MSTHHNPNETIPTPLEESCCSINRPFIAVVTFAIFTIIAMTIGILVVCLTQSKETNTVCKLTFKSTVKYPIGYDSFPLHAAVGDFNKDNHQDLVVAYFGTDSIGIFFGYGNRTFRNQTIYSTGLQSFPCWVAVNDFNNDTLLDIAVANQRTNSIGIFLSSGNGNFSNQITFSLGSSRPFSFAVEDFNNDHQLDIAVSSLSTSNIVILFGLNNGIFHIGSIIDMGYDSMPYSLAVADFNNDNHIDIAVVNYGISTLTILLGNGFGIFINHKYSTGSGSNPCSLVVGDFNNDNILDIAVANNGTRNIGVFLGYGNGTFRKIITYPTGSVSSPQFIVTSDFDNDTNLDLAIANTDYANIRLLVGDGNGSFIAAEMYETGPSSTPKSLVIGDFDNDNRSDIAIVNAITNNILILSSFIVHLDAYRLTYSTGAYSTPDSIAIGDFNHDNQLDIVIANINSSSIGVFLGLGNGSFENQTIYFIKHNARPKSVTVADFNNDDNLDIVVGVFDINAIYIYLGYGNGAFEYTNIYQVEGSYPFSIAVGDFNKDNNTDIVTAIYGTNNAGIFLGHGNGSFTIIKTYAPDSDIYSNSVGVGDFNNDGFLDFAVAHFQRATISIHLGYGNGSFHISQIISTDVSYPLSITIGDLNNDTQLDLIYADPYTSGIGILFGYENGTFGSIKKYSTGAGSFPYSVGLAYLNNDTFLDIVVVNQWYFSISIILGYGNETFGVRNMFSTGVNSFPSSIAFGDFNHDNQLDIVVTNTVTNDFHVFILYYSANFTNQIVLLTGSRPHPHSIAINDFNNNNQTDIAVANAGTNNVQIFLDYEKGNFMKNFTYPTGFNSRPQYVTTADINKDNQLDIVVANYWMNNINVFLGFGDGTFDKPTVHSTGSGSLPCSIAIGDFRKDNWMDVVVVNSNQSNIGVFLGFDYPTFTNYDIRFKTHLVLPFCIIAADFNNDNQMDIIVSNSGTDSIDVLLGHGDGTFIHNISYSTGPTPKAIAFGDFNNDKLLDIAVANSGNSSISIFLGYGDGAFAKQMLFSSGSSSPNYIAVGDFNQDGSLDIVVANEGNDYIRLFIGYGNGSFVEKISYWTSTNSSAMWIAVNDFNNDHILDLAVTIQERDEIEIFLGYGNGLFRNKTTYSTGLNSKPYSIAVEDLNNDDTIDIVVSNQDSRNVIIYFGYGNGTFSPQKPIPISPESLLTMIAIADLNNDKILDIVVADVANGYGNISVLYGYGSGQFATLKTYSTGAYTYPSSFVISDFNNDSRIDLAVLNPTTATIIIMFRDKSTPFATQTHFSTGNNSVPTSVAVGDFNNDHQLDIAVANAGTNNIGIFIGHGDGTFDKQRTYSTGDFSFPNSIAVNDFNNDHQSDIVIANLNSSNIGIFFGYGNGSFSIMTNYSTGIGSSPSSIAVADLNKDNRLDLVVVDIGTNKMLVFYGLDNGIFGDPEPYSISYDSRPLSVSIQDFDNDGRLDIAVACFSTDYIEIFLQTC
ncbi:unnamed protein product [Rotaria sordida]|uniref:Uncharacterized protein n=1 Tax=Rotaria sordida TaxID=392033 RepID=A0A814ZC52_9BILA|nr:unnamed protein product [Rotaria sordida]CAF1523125.1 unnamed protein product [Rotaria sordida]